MAASGGCCAVDILDWNSDLRDIHRAEMAGEIVMDDADRADKRITDTVDDGLAAARRGLTNNLKSCGV